MLTSDSESPERRVVQIKPLRVLTKYDAAVPNRDPVRFSPVLEKLKAAAQGWLHPLRSLWNEGDIEIYLEVGGDVHPAWHIDDRGGQRIQHSSFSASLPGWEPDSPRTNSLELCWWYFSAMAKRGLNEFPRKVNWSVADGKFSPDQVIDIGDFQDRLTWMKDAQSCRRCKSDEQVPLHGSRGLWSMLRQLRTSSSRLPDSVSGLCDLLNQALQDDRLLQLTKIDQFNEEIDPTQKTFDIAPAMRLLSRSSLFSDRLELRRVWIEACLHRPEPVPRKKDAYKSFKGMKEFYSAMPLSPLIFKDLVVMPIYLRKPSKLLGMICFRGRNADKYATERLAPVGDIIDNCISGAVRDMRLFTGGAFAFKACESDNEVLEVLSRLSVDFIGANDSCIRFLTNNEQLRCAHANCQYQHAEFGPNIDVPHEGTVQDNLNSDGRDGEIIDDYLNDPRQRKACSFFEEEHNLTFYDGASVLAKLQHNRQKGIVVLSHLAQSFYSMADFVDLSALCKLAEMRLDEILAKHSRALLRVADDPMDRFIYRNILRNLAGTGPAAFLDKEMGRRSHYAALIAREDEHATTDPKIDNYRDDDKWSLLDNQSFRKAVFRLTRSQDIVRAFWLEKDKRRIWTDMFHNSRQPQRTNISLPRSARGCRVVFFVPLVAMNDCALWFERNLDESELEDPRSVIGFMRWRKFDKALASLLVAIDAERLTMLRFNADVGAVVQPMLHNIRGLVSNVGHALRDFYKRLEEMELSEQAERLGYHDVFKALSLIDPAIDNLSRMSQEPSLKPMPAEELLSKLLRALNQEVEFRGIDFVLEPGAGVRGSVLVDFDHLLAAFREILANAEDAMEATATKKIWLTPEGRGGRLLIHFDDSGPGVAPELVNTLFEYSSTTKGRGRGIGLYFSQNIMHAQRGGLSVGTSFPGRGARFTFDLPLDSRQTS